MIRMGLFGYAWAAAAKAASATAPAPSRRAACLIHVFMCCLRVVVLGGATAAHALLRRHCRRRRLRAEAERIAEALHHHLAQRLRPMRHPAARMGCIGCGPGE